MKLKGIIFDLDSTLIQAQVDFVTMKKHMIKLLEKHGHPKDTLSPTDQTTVQIMEHAEKKWQRQNKPETQRQKLRDQITLYMNQGEIESITRLQEIPGAEKALKKLHQKGYKLAILTRSHHEYAIQTTKKTNMIDYFDIILGRDETPQPKPYKEAINYTAKQMNLNINEIVMIGDHQIDWDAAKNSGCRFIGVATGRRGLKSWDKEEPPKEFLTSISELPKYIKANYC